MRVLFLCEVNARTAAFGEVCEFIVYCDTVCFKREKCVGVLYVVSICFKREKCMGV